MSSEDIATSNTDAERVTGILRWEVGAWVTLAASLPIGVISLSVMNRFNDCPYECVAEAFGLVSLAYLIASAIVCCALAAFIRAGRIRSTATGRKGWWNITGIVLSSILLIPGIAALALFVANG